MATCQALKDFGFDQTLVEGDRVYQGALEEALLVVNPEGTMEAQGDAYLRCPSADTLMDAVAADSMVKEGDTWYARKGAVEGSGVSREEAAAALVMAL